MIDGEQEADPNDTSLIGLPIGLLAMLENHQLGAMNYGLLTEDHDGQLPDGVETDLWWNALDRRDSK
ncbi:MAG: hypothetical protein AAF670_04330 [Planctomycetota bacterium]